MAVLYMRGEVGASFMGALGREVRRRCEVEMNTEAGIGG